MGAHISCGLLLRVIRSRNSAWITYHLARKVESGKLSHQETLFATLRWKPCPYRRCVDGLPSNKVNPETVYWKSTPWLYYWQWEHSCNNRHHRLLRHRLLRLLQRLILAIMPLLYHELPVFPDRSVTLRSWNPAYATHPLQSGVYFVPDQELRSNRIDEVFCFPTDRYRISSWQRGVCWR